MEPAPATRACGSRWRSFPGYVRLGVAGGVTLPDPDGLLEGTGKVHRHIKIRAAEQWANPALHALLQAALAT